MKVVGIVIDVDGKYFVKDKDENVRRLKLGDEIYEGERVYGEESGARIVIESPFSNEKIILFGLDEYVAGEFGHIPEAILRPKPVEEAPIDEPTKTTTKSSDSSQSIGALNNAIGFQEIFLARDGRIVNVEAALINATNNDTIIDDDKTNDVLAFSPKPELFTSDSEVEDNFYDTYFPSGSNTAVNSFTFEALSGLKSVTVGTLTLSKAEVEALSSTPKTISMVAGELTLDGFSKIDNDYTINYTYVTNGAYQHDEGSDLFIDFLSIVITDVGGQTATGSLSINVIDDTPVGEDDTNSLQEGQLINYVTGNVLQDIDHNNSFGNFSDKEDHVGADSSATSDPLIGVSNVNTGTTGSIGAFFDGEYGELLLKADGSYKFIVDNTNPTVRALVDGESLNEVFKYTIIDDDGDTATATLNIEIQGDSSTPHLVAQDGSVDESALDVIGTTPASNSEFFHGNIIGTANDVFTKIVFTASNGTILTVNSLSAIDGSQTLSTPEGILTLNSYTETPPIGGSGARIGNIGYTYELLTPYDNPLISDSFKDIIDVTITDANGATGSDNLIITIVDDKPIAVDDVNAITEDAAEVNTVSGNVLSNDNDGADTNLTPITAQTTNGQYGNFVLNADGSYTYTLDNDNPAVDALNDGDTLTDTLTYTITDADGDTNTADLIITINGFTDPQLSVADVSVVEDGTSGNLLVIFTINLDKPSARDISFDFTTLNGTAKDGLDYTYSNGSKVITAQTTSITVSVPLLDDYIADDAENFTLEISNVNTSGSILDASGTATINDDSVNNTPYNSGDTVENSQEIVTLKLVTTDASGIELGTPLANSVAEGQAAYYKVVLEDPSGNRINTATGTVNIVKVDLTASGTPNAKTGLADYDGATPVNVSVNTVFSIDTIDDFVSDNGETFTVALANDTSYSNASDYENVTHDLTVVTTTINDDSDTVVLDLSGDVTVVEDDAASYTLTLSQISETDTIVDVIVTHIDTDNLDIVAQTIQVTVLAGSLTQNFTIDTLGDTVYEGNEDYKVTIAINSDGFEDLQLGNDEVITTIIDNDTPQISISDITLQEDGTAILTISSDITAKNDMTFSYFSSDGTANTSKDYMSIVGDAVISAGATSTTITVTGIDDYFADDGETFNVKIASTDTALNITKDTGVVTINDNTGATTDEIGVDTVTLKLITTDVNGDPLTDVTKNSVDEGYKAYYKVVFTDGSGNVLDKLGNTASGSVNIAYTNGAATGGDGTNTNVDDYVNTLTTVEINTVFSVTAVNDNLNEAPDETFEVNIVDASYTNKADYETVVYDTSKVETTIVNNTDTPVYVHLVNDATVSESDGALLTHTIELRDGLGNSVNLDSGKKITVNLIYSNDDTVDADFQTKITQVNIVGDGGSTYTFSNIVTDDFLKEGTESYTLSIGSVVDDNTPVFYEDLVKTSDTVTGTINDEASPDIALVSIFGAQDITEGDFSKRYTVQVDQKASDVSTDIKVTLIYSGTAINGTDFTGQTEVIIKAGTNLQKFTIATINDDLIEGSEDFTISIGAITDTNFEAISADPSASSVLSNIIDDVDAHPEEVDLKEGGSSALTPNLLANDELGVNAKVVGFTYKDESGSTQNGVIGTQADTQYGRITVNADGSFTYFSDPQENHSADGNTDTAVLKDIINYTIEDDNKETSSSTLTLNVGDKIGSIVDSAVQSVDEDDLPDGTDGSDPLVITNIDLGIQASADGVESVTFDLSDVSTALGSLSSQGVDLTYSLSVNGNVFTAKAGLQEIFVITLNQNGGGSSYDFELKGPLDHVPKTVDMELKIPFQYKEIGATEDTVKGNLTVKVVNDIPEAVNDVDATVVEGTVAPITGNVLTNDKQGADGALLHDFKYKDTSGTLHNEYFSDTTTSYTVDTPTGSLTVNRDGSWSFTAHTYVDHDDAVQGDTQVGGGADNDSTQGSFDYRLQDYDEDNSNYATQVIHVTDGADPTSSGVVNAVDEDDLVSGSDTTKEAVLVNGNLSVTGGSDPVDVTFTTTQTPLTSNGVAINYVLSNNGHTLKGMAGTVEVFEAIITTPSTNNPAYTFELKAQLDHPNAAGQNTLDLALEYKTTDIDGDSVVSSLVITITDDIPTIGDPVDGVVDEKGLPYGSATDLDLTKVSGNLDVKTEADSIDTIFTAQTITTLEALNIQAGAVPEDLIYTLSNSGHTLTATGAGKTIFTVDIKNADSTNASYDFILVNSFHHEGETDKDLIFNFVTNDYDGDSDTDSFIVNVIDDTGVATKEITVNEDGRVDFGLTADSILSISPISAPHGIVTFDSATNLFTYTPDADYSSWDTFDITYTTSSGDTTTTVNATVNPISDAPTVSLDALSIQTDEDTAVALGFNAPTVKDDFDQNDITPGSHDVLGDNPERLSLITLDGFPNGAKVYYGSTIAIMDGSAKTILLSDLDNNSDGVNDHLAGLTADYTMTVAEFESLFILPPLNSGDNFDVTMKVISYEVDDAGAILAGVAGKKSTQTLHVDVHAKTDDGVAISANDASGNEDEWMRIDDSITITKTLDTDGSEKYELVFDGANLPSGTLYYQGTPTDMSDRSIGSDASAGFSVNIPDIDDFIAGNYPIYVMTPINDSTDISNLSITINVHDTDADSTPTTDVINSDTARINISVVPIANDITVSTTGSQGSEDTKIPLNFSFTNADATSESITSVTIAGIPTDAKLFDNLGNEVSVTAGSVTITIIAGDTTDIEAYTIQPPAHSSADITLQVSMETQDKDDGGGQALVTGTIAAVNIVVKVDAVTETELSDSADPSGNDVSMNDSHYYDATHGAEDTFFALNSGGFTLVATNEDDSAINPHGSENTFMVFTNIHAYDEFGVQTPMSGGVLKYNDGSQDIELTFSSVSEIEVPIAYLSSVEVKASQDFAGTIVIDTFTRTQDFDEDDNTAALVEDSAIRYLAINIDPVVDGNPIVSTAQSGGDEDDGRAADGKITLVSVVNAIEIKTTIDSNDSDGSEKFRVFFDDIPEDGALYFKGHIIYANSADDFIADGISVIRYDSGTFKVQLEDYNSASSAKIVPPHNSDTDFTIKASVITVDTAILADGTVVEVIGTETTPLDIDISINEIADQVINTELKTFDVTDTTPLEQSNGDLFSIDEKLDGSGAYNAVVQEDSSSTGNGASISLKVLFETPVGIDSYDNIYSNKINISPVLSTSKASENVTITLTNLGADFDVSGATLVSGTGTDRIWTFTLAELKDGSTSITTPKNFSGELDFKMKFIATENEGNTKEGSFEDIKILVTPVAEDLSISGLNPLDIQEDVLTKAFASFTSGLPDDNGNPETIHELWVKVSDVTGKDFKLFIDSNNDGSGSEYDEVDGSEADVSTENIGGIDYYHFQNATQERLYVQYASDLGPNPVVDKDVDIKITFIDYVDVGGQIIANVSNRVDLTYSLDLQAVTDDIDAKAITVTDTDGDVTDDIASSTIDSNGDVIVNPTSNTQVTVNIKVLGVDTAGEVDISTGSASNTIDDDSSEQIIGMRIDGVPKGVGIQDGYYSGDKDLDSDGVTEYTGIWYVDFDPNDTAFDMDGDSVSYDLKLNIEGDNSIGHEIAGTITVSFINQDGAESTTQDSVTIVIDDSNYSGVVDKIPMDILEWNDGGNIDVIIEDTSITLGAIVTFSIDETTVGNNAGTSYNGISGIADGTAVTSNKFSITIEGLQNATVNGWTQDSYGGTFWTYHGQGGATAIQAALDALIITPNQDYNQNHDTAQGDSSSVFNEGPLAFTTTLTTYADNGYSDTQSLNYNGNVEPVTDHIEANEVFIFTDADGSTTVEAFEDGKVAISASITTVDNPYVTILSTDVRITNVSPDNIGAIVSGGTNEVLNGQIKWTSSGGWVNLDKGTFVDVPLSEIQSVEFKLDQYVAGNVKLEYSVEAQENASGSSITAKDTVDFYVNPVAQGLEFSVLEGIGNEDTYIELKNSNGDSFDAMTLVDPTETLSSMTIDGIPNGYLVFYGDTHQNAASVINVDASGHVTFNVDISGGVPKVWILPPANIGGVSTLPLPFYDRLDAINVNIGVDDMGVVVYNSEPALIIINAIADDVTINPTASVGDEGSQTALNFNATVIDTDLSERLIVTLAGLGKNAVFFLDGIEINKGYVKYNVGTDTYTISHTDINYTNVSKISFIQNNFSGTVTATVEAWENSNLNHDGLIATDTFNVTISQQNGTGGNDELFFDEVNGNDGLGGDDTLVFGYNYSKESINFTAFDDNLHKNIEVLDLTQHGNHEVILSSSDVQAMTDSTNDLVINSDAGDNIIVQNSTADIDNVWAQVGSTDVYTSAKGESLTINGGASIDDLDIKANNLDNVLGYNDTNTIDGELGNDRLIIFDGVEVDFTKVINVEIIDFSVVGDHTVTDLKLTDVINATDGKNSLKFLGDSADSVDFDTGENWVKNDAANAYSGNTVTEGGKTFDVYTSINDASVEVKVEDTINDSI